MYFKAIIFRCLCMLRWSPRSTRTYARVPYTAFFRSDTNFEYSFWPGAAGQVGYEVFGGKRGPDCYSLLFANLVPEVIMQALQKPSVKLGEDVVYINQISSEVMSLFVAANSQFQSIEQLAIGRAHV